MNYTMESSGNELAEPDQHLLEQLICILKCKFEYEICQKRRQKNVAELLSLKAILPHNQFKTYVQLKNRNDGQISITIAAIGAIQNGDLDYKKMEHHAATFNKKYFTQSYKVIWDNKNRNFSIFKNIFLQTITRQKRFIVSKQFFTSSIQELLNALTNCISEIVGNIDTPELLNKQIKVNSNSVALKKKIQTLEYFKYKFEQSRHLRQKSTKLHHFYGTAYANYQELSIYLDRKKANEEHIEIEFKDISKSVEKEEAEKSFEKIIEAFHRYESEKQCSKNRDESTKQIANAIKFYESKIIAKEQKMKNFSHMNMIEASYGIIFSVNGQTNKIAQNYHQGCNQKKQKSILIQKFKCNNCHIDEPQKAEEHRLIFENEKEILLILKNQLNDSICTFFIEQYDKKENIQSIYSKKMPMDPITKLYKPIETTTNIPKCIFNILKFLTEVSEGICFLDSQKIIHRDLKPNNIMLDEKKRARIIDFGSACPIYGSVHKLNPKLYSTLRSTYGYYFPYASLPLPLKAIFLKDEYYQHSSFDVYSLGAIAEAMLEPYILEAERIGISQQLIDNTNYFVKKCKDIQPDDRLIPIETSLFLRFLASAFQLLIRKSEST